MSSIGFLKTAYVVAWLVYLGYLGWILRRYQKVRHELKDIGRPS